MLPISPPFRLHNRTKSSIESEVAGRYPPSDVRFQTSVQGRCMEEQWTVLKVLQWTTEYFKGKGFEQPRADAEVLLAHALGMERVQLYLNYDKPLSP